MADINISRVEYIKKLIKEGKTKTIWEAFVRRIYSEEVCFAFKRDLNLEIKKPRSLVKVTTRVAQESDEVYFKDNEKDGLMDQLETCYVAINKEEIPCFRVWLLDASQNEKLENIWKGTFPHLNKDEILLENIFTVPQFRGMGIMATAMDIMADKCKELGANYAITIVHVDDTNIIRSLNYVGFEPYILRTRKWVLFNKSIKFKEIPNNLMEQYHKATNRKYK